MSTLNSVKLYGRVALLRRQVLLQQLIRRAVAGALAVAAFVTAAGLGTYALFLGIVAPLGALGATLTIAALYLVCSLLLLAYTLRERRSPELQALEEMEAAALDTLTADTQGMAQIVQAAGHRVETLGSSLTLGIGIVSALRRLLASRKS
ncbi:hypothetical protein [Azospirillum rugosum]|uniref:Holin-X, holin superfamily III n=1 Tax=Azospirillum rugosum TaxID=416170 RepID=A0ABS4SXF6_9PROT|nr:hypothetical protein [Azospirillum rugosum]MBP2297242.1 hypothetical protein [Azospirillum rugosum]MDQ0531084.1 hypothetical protein [Azospirillum rugosum]